MSTRARFAAELGFALDGFQRQALDALDAGGSVVVAAPTGSGKTVVAQYAVARALDAGAQSLLHHPAQGPVQPEVRRAGAPPRRRARSACSPATTPSTATPRWW